MTSFAHIRTFYRIQFGRHIRSPALWFVALAAPIIARFIVPDPEASYSIISINNARPNLTAGVIGMEIGIIAGLFLSPFAYIFLRAGPTKTVPWQVEDTCPSSRIWQMVGNWIADTLVLWLILLCLAVAGVIISLFRLPLTEVVPIDTLLAAIFIAAPALCFVAAVRTFLSARPKLRGALGDVVFVVIWLGGTLMASVYFVPGQTPVAIADLFGFAASMSPAVAEPIRAMSMPGLPGTTDTININAMRGVLDPSFLLSRVFWIFMAMGVACLSGLVFKPRSQKAHRKHLAGRKWVGKLSVGADRALQAIGPTGSKTLTPLWENFSQILTPKLYVYVLMGAAIIGGLYPFTPQIGALLWLAVLFPLTDHSARWQSRNLTRFASTAPMSKPAQLVWQYCAGLLLVLLVCLPALVKGFTANPTAIPRDLLILIIGLPLIITAFGALTRSAFFARLLLLLAWYMYLNL